MSEETAELHELRDRVTHLQRLLADALNGGDRTVIDSMFEGVQLIGRDWRYLYLNAAACEHGRRERDELVGRTMMECYPGIEETEMFRLLLRCRDEGTPQSMVNEFAYSDGHKAWFELRIEPVPQGVLVLSVDITERRRVEEELRQAQKMEAIGQLAGGIAHDFNNLLTAIMSFTDLTIRSLPEDDSRRRGFLEEVMNAARGGATLTSRLLTLARSSSTETRVVDVNDTVTALDTLLRRTLGANIKLVTIPSRGAAPVRIEPGQLQQILLNLAVNARDAMADGGTLSIETSVDAERDRVVVLVEDTGSGMDAGTRERAFEPFFSTKGPGGTGLGLAICRRIVEGNGGAIRVTSEIGDGTAIEIELPRADAAPEIAEVGHACPGDDAPRGPGTVLVVEDAPVLLALISDTLRRRGFHVIDARSSEEALGVVQRTRSELTAVVADVSLPGMTGYELLDELDAFRRRVPVLVMSGELRDVPQPVGEERVEYLRKPFTSAELLARLGRVLR